MEVEILLYALAAISAFLTLICLKRTADHLSGY